MDEYGEKNSFLGAGLRYPLFFIGVMMMAIGGNMYKFTSFPLKGVEAIVAVGFVIFVISMIPVPKRKH